MLLFFQLCLSLACSLFVFVNILFFDAFPKIICSFHLVDVEHLPQTIVWVLLYAAHFHQMTFYHVEIYDRLVKINDDTCNTISARFVIDMTNNPHYK